MEKLYVTYTVKIADNQYAYKGRRGEAEARFQAPPRILPEIDPGTLFQGLVAVALADFEASEPPEKEE